MTHKFTKPKRYKELAQGLGYTVKDLAENLNLTHQDAAKKLLGKFREDRQIAEEWQTFRLVLKRESGEGASNLTCTHRGGDKDLQAFLDFIDDTERLPRLSPTKTIICVGITTNFLYDEDKKGTPLAEDFMDFMDEEELAALDKEGVVADKEEVLELKTEEAETEKIDDPLENFPTEEEIRDSGYHYLLAIASTWKDVQEELGRLRRENRSLEENANPNIKAMLDRLSEKDEEIFNLKASLKSATASLEKAREEFKKIQIKMVSNDENIKSLEDRLSKQIGIVPHTIEMKPPSSTITVRELLFSTPNIANIFDKRYPAAAGSTSPVDQRIGFSLAKFVKDSGQEGRIRKKKDERLGYEVNAYPIDIIISYAREMLGVTIVY